MTTEAPHVAALKAFNDATGRLMAAGQTLAAIVRNTHTCTTDPTVARMLEIHAEANTAYDAAFMNLMGTADPVPDDLADKSIAAMRDALTGDES